MTFCYILPLEHFFYVSSNNWLAYWDSTGLGTAFLWWKNLGEITLLTNCSLSQVFLGRSLSENLRNAHLKTYYTP